MVLLDTDAFLSELSDMYMRCTLGQSSGTVFTSMKRHVAAPLASDGHHKQTAPEPCTLIRATCGKRKISTLVRDPI